MFRSFFFCIAAFLFVSCGEHKEQLPTDFVKIPVYAKKGINKSDLPEMTFEEDVFDFGTITQGEKVTYDFKFKNTGSRDLIISSASADCGCTVPEVPKKPIAPGKGDIIRVSFDSENRSGIITKDVTIMTNCIPNKQVIKIKANIFVPQTNNPIKP